MMIRRAIVFAALLGCCLCAARAQKSSKERVKAFAKLPDWSGLWQFDVAADELDGQQLGAEGLRRAKAYAAALQPSFTPAWQPMADQFRKTQDAALAADRDHPPAHGSPCAAPPFPATMLPGYYEWRITPEETTLIGTLGSVRHIYTDGRPHPPKDELWPTNEGDSIGRWEGDTLVVDTVAVKQPLIISLAEPITLVGPLSNEFHAVERIRTVNDDQMQIRFTADDPAALAKPINVTITWERVKDLNRVEENEDECNPAADRNPIVNGRFTTILTPAPATPAAPPR
jgi:hypothetical protein